MAKNKFTLKQQINCIQREIALREKLYPDWVKQNKLKAETAEYELSCLRAVIETLKGAYALGQEILTYFEEAQDNQPPLFKEAANG